MPYNCGQWWATCKQWKYAPIAYMSTEGEMGFVGNVSNGFLMCWQNHIYCKVAVRLGDVGRFRHQTPSVLATTEIPKNITYKTGFFP